MMHGWVLFQWGWCYTAGLVARFHPARSISFFATRRDLSRRAVDHEVGLRLVNIGPRDQGILLWTAMERVPWSWKVSAMVFE
jgi:hypothetical protein